MSPYPSLCGREPRRPRVLRAAPVPRARACASPPNVNALVDCGCCGCGVPGCVAGLWGWPPGASPSPGRARHASISVRFLGRLDEYQLTIPPSSRFRVPAGSDTSSTCSRSRGKLRSATVRGAKTETRILCTIYYPEERAAGAGRTRRSLDGQRRPEASVRHPAIFRHATSRVVVPGTRWSPCRCSRCWTRATGDYEQRVEPSVVGKEDGGGVSPRAPGRRRTVDDATMKGSPSRGARRVGGSLLKSADHHLPARHSSDAGSIRCISVRLVCAWPSVRLSVPSVSSALVPGGFRVDSLLATLVAFCSARRLAAAAGASPTSRGARHDGLAVSPSRREGRRRWW